MPTLFMSHATEDDTTISRIAAALRDNGVEPWIDHESLAPGINWDRAIQEAINTCDILLFAVSKHSIESTVCGDEWNHALDLEKLVVPIMIDDAVTNLDMPFRLKRLQWIDFRGDFDAALQRLLRLIGMKAAATTPPPNIVAGELPLLEWVNIPASETTLVGQDDAIIRVEVPAFEISKYPVLVAQYAVFVNEHGYDQQDVWTDTGWAWKTEQFISKPRFWLEKAWHHDRHPVVGVSWYEALAFTRWLGRITDSQIRLPEEPQWQAAAGGGINWAFAYGNTFDALRCNTMESEQERTTPADAYPAGVSPHGVYDLSGNVWEWCLNLWQADALGKTDVDAPGYRVNRGGSWRGDKRLATTIYRNLDQPTVRESFVGFRLVRL